MGMDILAKHNPKLVEGLIPDLLSLATVVKVLQTLLYEGVPIRDMRTIVQTLTEYAPKSQDPDVLVSAVRIALKRLIVQEINSGGAELPVITLAPGLEQMKIKIKIKKRENKIKKNSRQTKKRIKKETK